MPLNFRGQDYSPPGSDVGRPTQQWNRATQSAESTRTSGDGTRLRAISSTIFRAVRSEYLDDTCWQLLATRNTSCRPVTAVIQRCILMTTDPGDLVLDPTCGSGTTAYVAEQWGRRWITIDTSRVALALARARIMGARYPYYLLADSPRRPAQGSGSHTNAAIRSSDARRHPSGLRLRARAAHHA